MARQMVALDDVMQVAANEARDAFDTMAAADQQRTCKWMRGLRRGLTEAQVRRSMEKHLKAKAIDWDAILAFVEKVMPLILSLISKL